MILNLQPTGAIDYAAFNRLDDRTKMTDDWLPTVRSVRCRRLPMHSTGHIPFHQVTGVLNDDPHVRRESDEWIEAAQAAHTMAHNRLGPMGHYYKVLRIARYLNRIARYLHRHHTSALVFRRTSRNRRGRRTGSFASQLTAEEVTAKRVEFAAVFDIQQNAQRPNLTALCARRLLSTSLWPLKTLARWPKTT